MLHDLDPDKPQEYEIRRQLYRLDEVAHKHETKWGYEGAVVHCSAETAEKWARQKIKLDDAIARSDPLAVEALVDGMIRGYAVIEQEAERNGGKPNPPEVWDFTHPESGRHYRICKTSIEARRSVADGVCVYTLEEVARILEAAQLVNMAKETFPESKVVGIRNNQESINWEKGDDMPF